VRRLVAYNASAEELCLLVNTLLHANTSKNGLSLAQESRASCPTKIESESSSSINLTVLVSSPICSYLVSVLLINQ
jgi:hypothetical protein